MVSQYVGMPYMGGVMDDIYGRQLYYQMNNGQMPYSPINAGGVGGGNTPNTQNTQVASKGGINPLVGAVVAGGGTYLAGTYLDFIKPVDEAGKYTEEFLQHYSAEYAAMNNGEALKGFYSGVGKGVNAENFGGLMTELERLGLQNNPEEITKAAKTNPLLKSFLEEKGILKADGTLVKDALEKVRGEFATHKFNFNNIMPSHNYTVQTQMAERFKGLEKAWKACTTKEAQIKFLKENAAVLGIERHGLSALYFNPEGVNVEYFNKYFVESRGKFLNEAATQTKTCMQGALEGTWKAGEKWWQRGAFKGSTEAATEAATKGLKSLRKSRCLPLAIGAAIVTGLICLFTRN